MSDNTDNVPILKDGTANPNFLMTRKQAIAVLQVIRSGNLKSDGDMLNKIICDKAISLAIRGLERPHGKWVFDKDGYFSCPCCKRKPAYQVTTMDFCPNCGADMREGERNE